jgi:uncharacterized membrane protein YgcG
MLTACSRKPICSAQPSPLPTLLTPTDPQTMSRTVPVRSARTQQQQPQPTQDGEYRIDFGSHRGRTLAEAPASWIRWVLLREVYLDRPALRLALEQAGHLRPGNSPAPDVRYGTHGGGAGGGSGSGGSSSDTGKSKDGFAAFSGGGNVLGGQPADR